MSIANDSVGWLLEEAGFVKLTAETPLPVVEEMLRTLIRKLNGADPLRRATIRQVVIDRLTESHVPGSARLVDAALGVSERLNGGASGQGQVVAFADPEPWPDAVDGADLLAQLQRFLGRFLGLPNGADALLAAFSVATYAVEIFSAAPYIVVHSPAPQCGKTRALEVLALLVRRPWLTIVPSTAVLFRVLELSAPTLLVDEAEVVNGRGDAAGDLRALLQSGYRRGAVVPRCVGDSNEVRSFRTFGPKTFALIGQLPPALFDRCIPVEMQRRQRAERLERFRPTRLRAETLVLQRMARRWVSDHAAELGAADPAPLETLDERQQEVWDPLFAVGLVAGGRWYERLVAAALVLSGGRAPTSLGLTLLADARGLLDGDGADRLLAAEADRVSSADLAAGLNGMEGRPWADWNRGKGLTPNGLARLLHPFGIRPATMRLGDGKVLKGYLVEQFGDAFARYLAPEAPAAVTSLQPNQDAGFLGDVNRNAVPAVTDAKAEMLPESGHCNAVTVQNAGRSELKVTCARCGQPCEPGPWREQLCNPCARALGDQEVAERRAAGQAAT